MVNGPNSNYQPAVAYQGGLLVDNPLKDPKSGETQPRQAPAAADTQRGDQRSLDSPDSKERGQTLDVKA